MEKIWITSDLHFNHDKPFLYEPRGFTSIQDMNEEIVRRWNSVVRPDEYVYNLGDIALNDVPNAIPYIKRLNGYQIWLLGNHDTHNKVRQILQECPNIALFSTNISSYAALIKYNKLSIYLSHYPTITSNYDDKHFSQHVLSIHGHTHSKEKWMDPNNPFLYNVCLDAHDCYPVSLDEIINDCKVKFQK